MEAISASSLNRGIAKDLFTAAIWSLQDLLNLYTKAGVKGTPVTFIITDNQVVIGSALVCRTLCMRCTPLLPTAHCTEFQSWALASLPAFVSINVSKRLKEAHSLFVTYLRFHN